RAAALARMRDACPRAAATAPRAGERAGAIGASDSRGCTARIGRPARRVREHRAPVSAAAEPRGGDQPAGGTDGIRGTAGGVAGDAGAGRVQSSAFGVDAVASIGDGAGFAVAGGAANRAVGFGKLAPPPRGAAGESRRAVRAPRDAARAVGAI